MNLSPTLPYRHRVEAGQILAAQLSAYVDRTDVIVLALPRGGVPVAYEVARALDAPLDVFVVRKLGVPGREELAMGALATGGVRILNHEVIRALNISPDTIEAVTAQEQQELARREQLYRGDLNPLDVGGRAVIIVDDGLATGSTMRVAVRAVRRQQPACIVVGVPVASTETCEQLSGEVDEIVCAATPEPFYAVGLWYEDFSETGDQEERRLLREAAHEELIEAG